MYVAHYHQENLTEVFNTFKEAEEWLTGLWFEDMWDDGYADDSINGKDYIAKVTHVSDYRWDGIGSMVLRRLKKNKPAFNKEKK